MEQVAAVSHPGKHGDEYVLRGLLQRKELLPAAHRAAQLILNGLFIFIFPGFNVYFQAYAAFWVAAAIPGRRYPAIQLPGMKYNNRRPFSASGAFGQSLSTGEKPM
jgi:hypothetical protein